MNEKLNEETSDGKKKSVPIDKIVSDVLINSEAVLVAINPENVITSPDNPINVKNPKDSSVKVNGTSTDPGMNVTETLSNATISSNATAGLGEGSVNATSTETVAATKADENVVNGTEISGSETNLDYERQTSEYEMRFNSSVIHITPGSRAEAQIPFTNKTGDFVLQQPDLSFLRPGDTPGDARLQIINETFPLAASGESSEVLNSTTQNITDIDKGNVSTINIFNENPPRIEINATETTDAVSTPPTVIIAPAEAGAPEEGKEKEMEFELKKKVDSPISQANTDSVNNTLPPSITTLKPPILVDKPPTVNENQTSETIIISSEVNIRHGDKAEEHLDTPPMPIDFGTIVNASSDLGSMVGNTTVYVETVTASSGSVEQTSSQPASLPGTTTTTTTIATLMPNTSSSDLTTTTTPSPTTTTPKNPCAKDQIECVNGTSPLGRCIPKTALCNSIPDCYDNSDEIHCFENNCFGNFQCNDNECIERQYVCDGVTNCRDGDDEINCNLWECLEDEFKCTGPEPSPCIPLGLRCDGQPDCFDHSDEVNCSTSCESDEFFCAEGWCIPSARKCDGIRDCYGGEDEENCDCVGLDETRCEVGGCVPTFQLCDGLRQCPDGSDEWECLRIENSTHQLEVRSGANRWSAVCGEEWASQWSDLVCKQLGFQKIVSYEVKRASKRVLRPRVKLAPNASPINNTPLQYALTSACTSDSLVHISCDPWVCGVWQYGTDVATKEGVTQVESQWPSLALLLPTHPINDTHLRAQSCTASILTPVWILAAYSCLSSKENGLSPTTWAVETGKSTSDGSTQFHYIDKMVFYPGMMRKGGLWSGDAVLMHLDKPLSIDNTTQPICVPDAPPPTDAHCVVAGWNRTHYGTSTQSQFLHSLPVPSLGPEDCNTTHYQGRLTNTHTCFGFAQAQHPPCHGDEGSPLMCMSASGVWRLEGLLSHHARCDRAKHPSIFTALHALQPWLGNTIGTPLMYDSSASTAPTTSSTTTTTTSSTTTTTSSSTTPTTVSTTVAPSASTSPPPPPPLSSEDFDRPQVSSPGNAPLPL
ncbi:hypothetical protein SK128_011675 [Halocaridina rubra]|uniref:Uncharacterized protein n=1 Tax=Halocaridina rubra TaxID=373956 RepID=A0AAN8XHS6_HALRR